MNWKVEWQWVKDYLRTQGGLFWLEFCHQVFGYRLSPLQRHILAERAKVTRDFWFSVMRGENWTCYLCGHYKCWFGGMGMEVEHDVPVSRWGYTDRRNCHPSCHHCNKAKGRMTATEYRRRL